MWLKKIAIVKLFWIQIQWYHFSWRVTHISLIKLRGNGFYTIDKCAMAHLTSNKVPVLIYQTQIKCSAYIPLDVILPLPQSVKKPKLWLCPQWKISNNCKTYLEFFLTACCLCFQYISNTVLTSYNISSMCILPPTQ